MLPILNTLTYVHRFLWFLTMIRKLSFTVKGSNLGIITIEKTLRT